MPTFRYSPIDAVITWVDGNDPAHRNKLSRHLTSLARTPVDAQKTRFCSVDEIRYCVLSLFRFAPFLRNIYVVTDKQTPPIFEEVKRLYPHRADSLKLVDHTEIFRGYEHLLPTFSSRSIETMLFRIVGLSETFVYFNDDTILIGDTSPLDWFVDGVPVLRGKWRWRPMAELISSQTTDAIMRWVTLSKQSYVRSSYKLGQWKAAQLVGFSNKYFWSDHIPRPMRKSVIQEFYTRHPSTLEENASYRIRSAQQYNPQALAIHLELKQGNKNRQRDGLVCLKPVNRRHDYVKKKLRTAGQGGVQFLCVQSLDLATAEDQHEIHGWLERTLFDSGDG